MKCPLCHSIDINLSCKDKLREYFICTNCDLVFVPSAYHLSSNEEKERYDLHNNNPNDIGYTKFLERLMVSMLPMLNAAKTGLDFGCGIAPVLSEMFVEEGFTMDVYDPFYANEPSVFSKKYDFITSTEVVEHLYDPAFELSRLVTMLNSNGIIGIITQLRPKQDVFQNWWYKNDKTHVCFYSKKCFEWFANKYHTQVEFKGKDIVILTGFSL